MRPEEHQAYSFEDERKRIEECFCAFVEGSLVSHDIDAVLQLFCDDVIGIGMGAQGIVFSRAYNGRSGVVDGDIIADFEPALEHECDSRILVLLAQGKQDDTRYDDVLPQSLIYEHFDVQDGAARVIVNYAPRKGMDPWREGYVFKQDGRHWKLVNVITNANGGGDAVLDALADSDDPAAWSTTYAYSQLPRSAYDGLHEYSDYVIDDQSGVSIVIEGSGHAVDLESLKYEDAIAAYNRSEK